MSTVHGVYPAPPAYSTPAFSTPPVVQPTTLIVGTLSLGPYPANVQCPRCYAQIMTQTNTVIGLFAWIVCGVLFLVGCWLGCCLIPFCIRSMNDVEHRCPQCKNYLGVYKRLPYG